MSKDSTTTFQFDGDLSASEVEDKHPVMEVDDHVSPITTVKAIKADAIEQAMSDDEVPRVLTTLETVKKAPTEDEGMVEIELCPYEEDDEIGEENAVLLEVYHEEPESSAKAAKDSAASDPEGSIPVQHSRKNCDAEYFKPSALKLGHEISIKRVRDAPKKTDDLIAILEGDICEDNSEHYKLDIPSVQKKLSDEEAREIAIQQMMNLPTKKKGRPRLNPSEVASRKSRKPKASGNSVKELVSDWAEDSDIQKEQLTEFLVEIKNNGLAEINEIPKHSDIPTQKRSRVIRKKVIWDPDAPETAVNYASLAQKGRSTAQNQRKAHLLSEVADSSENAPEGDVTSPKRKKLTEIDKLLGDEGAANMLSSLNQLNSNKKMSRSKITKADHAEINSSKAKIFHKQTKDNKPQVQTSPMSAKKSGSKKALSAWDYVYSSRPDDCMIIRRRSNSSYSSTTSVNMSSALSNCDDFTKTNQQKSDNECGNVFEARNTKGKKQKLKSNGSSIPVDPAKEMRIVKHESFSQIILKGSSSLLTVDLMKKIQSALNSMGKDDSCSLVLISTEDDSFCNEIDTSSLHESTSEKRKRAALKLCKAVSVFVHHLIDFNKTLVLGIKGLADGFGLALMLLFDIVLSEKACMFGAFNEPHHQRVEGSSIISSSNKLNYNTKVELLCLNTVMGVEEAKRNNLVTRVLDGKTFDTDILQQCGAISTKDFGAIKLYLLKEDKQKLKENLEIEQRQLLQYWTSDEFYNNKIK